jgi:hypothetical protein
MEDLQNHPATSDVASLVNVTQYPIEELDTSAGRALIAHCRSSLDESGSLVLPNFVTPATALLAAEARGLDEAVHQYRVDHTVYFEPCDESVPESHPRRRLVRTDKGSIPYDLIPSSALLRRLYEWDPLRRVRFRYRSLALPLPQASLTLNFEGESPIRQAFTPQGVAGSGEHPQSVL